MTKKYSLASFSAIAVMFSLSFAMMPASPVAARELSIAIPHANLKAFTSEAECLGRFGTSRGCNNVLGKACSGSFGRGIWATESSFDATYEAIINKGATVKIMLLNDGSGGKIPGSFGPVVCELTRK